MSRARSSRRTPRRERALDPVLDFLRLLWSIEHGLQSTSKRMGATMGITGPQRLVLRVVSQYPDISAGELAHVVRLHPSTITGILQRLVAKRLLFATPTLLTPAVSACGSGTGPARSRVDPPARSRLRCSGYWLRRQRRTSPVRAPCSRRLRRRSAGTKKAEGRNEERNAATGNPQRSGKLST
jgi:hypothetical protein